MAANINDKLKSTWNSASPAPTVTTGTRAGGAGTLACQSLNWPTDTAVDFATFAKNPDGSVNQASVQEFTGIVSGNNLTNVVLTSGGSDQGNNIGDTVVMKPTSKGHQDLVDAVKVAHNQDGSLKNGIVGTNTLAQSTYDLIGSYSTSETATPFKWVDGKTIYKKTIAFGALPNNTTKSIPHGIAGIDFIVKAEGFAKDGSGNFLHIPFVHNSTVSNQVMLWTTTTNIDLSAGSNRSAFTVSYITLLYTKSA